MDVPTHKDIKFIKFYHCDGFVIVVDDDGWRSRRQGFAIVLCAVSWKARAFQRIVLTARTLIRLLRAGGGEVVGRGVS